MTTVTFVVPGRLSTLTGGYGYDRRIIAGLRELNWQVDVRELDDSFPQPTPTALDDAARVFASLPNGRVVVVDGLAFGALPDVAQREAARLRFIALVHHPLAEETGLDRAQSQRLREGERVALASARCVIVTSTPTAFGLQQYGVSTDRVVVIEPGTDPAPIGKGSTGTAVQLLCVSTLIPRKGHDALIQALASVASLEWHLTCVGSLERHPATTYRVMAQIRRYGLENRVTLVGEVGESALGNYYDCADVFVLPSEYEGYGMAVAEALARGVPVISTPTGGVADLLRDGAGLLVPPRDVGALARALARIIGDDAVRQECAAQARAVRERLPAWSDAATKMTRVLDSVMRDEPVQR